MTGSAAAPAQHAAAAHGSGGSTGAGGAGGFSVRLDNFEGPFDLLLSLISRRQLDLTEVALSQVTDEFLAHLGAAQDWDLGQATDFLVVAATLLDLKAARLLPSADVEDEDALALLEARDLLFARLLQYRAYKLAAAWLGELHRTEGRRHGRSAELEPRFAAALPELVLDVSPERLAQLATAAMAPRPVPTIATDHVHAPRVSVREHMAVLRGLLHSGGALTFRALVADCDSTMEVVARFLGVLELYREGAVAFDQAGALAELRVRWTEPGPAAGVADAADAADPAADVDEEYG